MNYQLLQIVVSVFTTMMMMTCVEACSSNDLEGLMSFKNGIQMDTSGRLAKWVIGQNCCKWEGIVCGNENANSSTTRVTEIHLSGFISSENGLSQTQTQMIGLLSPSLMTLLTALEILDLGGLVGLSGTIPQTLGVHLQKLQKLNLYGNNLSGSLPESIGEIFKS